MKLTIDTDRGTLTEEAANATRNLPLYSKEAFESLSRQWVRVGWALRSSYAFSWLGRPVIQLPEDLLRVQEVIHRLQPDVILETGVAHGGSLVFYASLCKVLGGGRLIGIDIEIREHSRQALEAHPLKPYITLLEGSSVDPAIVAQARALVRPGETVLVILDSCHTRDHVLAELEAYAPLVTPGSYIVATDGIMQDLHDVPGGRPEWRDDNPAAAAAEFAGGHPEFVLEQPPWPLNESALDRNVTHWPGGWLRRR